ncbi:MAG: MOSC N-terminal beta barrel domain-containing protein [Rhodocyclaceae bacterium]|nr:MOSC N-terminal beta barrel domain-containing protein [Rhodocyclaceae bacterium]
MPTASHITVTALYQHPVKSCAPLSLGRSYVDAFGLAGDRRYLVTDAGGQFLTGRQHPRLASLLATPIEGGLILAAAGQPDFVLRTADFPDCFAEVTVWRQTVLARRCGEAADQWLSDFLGTSARLVHFDARTQRPIKDVADRQVSFADGYPLLLASESSLEWLQEHCPTPLAMTQFRPNIVIDGAAAWAEDGWRTIRIGGLQFDLHSPCERCVFTTLAPRSETFHPRQQPLRTLIAHHSSADKTPLFGHNLIARGTGVIEIGMTVSVDA